jgi:hypothetical protein
MIGRPGRWLTALVLGLLTLLGIVGCAQSPGQTEDGAAVVNRFLAARESRNLEAVMDCFVDQPEMRSSLGVGWSGRDVIRVIMSYRLLDSYTVSDVRAVGNRVIWSEHVRRGAAGSLTATFDEDVEAIVVGGRIGSMVIYVGGTHPTPLSEPTPQLSAGANLLLPLSILLLVAGAVMVWPPTTALHAPRPANGQLLSGLRDYVARRG